MYRLTYFSKKTNAIIRVWFETLDGAMWYLNTYTKEEEIDFIDHFVKIDLKVNKE